MRPSPITSFLSIWRTFHKWLKIPRECRTIFAKQITITLAWSSFSIYWYMTTFRKFAYFLLIIVIWLFNMTKIPTTCALFGQKPIIYWTGKSLGSSLWFSNFSYVLPTSQLGHYVCKPRESALCCLTLYNLTSVCIFSILFSKHFLQCWQGEFVLQSKASLVGDQFLYSPDLNV